MLEYPDGFASDTHSKKPICGVLSVAICAGVSYDVAHATCKRVMLDMGLGQRFRGGTYHKQRREALKRLAVKFVEYPQLMGMTVSQFIERHAEQDRLYMVGVRGHIITIKNNAICDQSHLKNYLLSRCRNMKIMKPVIEITGKGW